jgi:hypothetical protein
MRHGFKIGVEMGAETIRTRPLHQKIVIASKWHVEQWRGGRLIASRNEENICPDEFINHILDVILSGGTQVTDWYIALFSDDHTPVIGDTYASPGFTEATGYDEVERPIWSGGGVSNKSITNSASKASFTMDGTDPTIYGAALVSVATKGDTGGGGILGPVAQFATGPLPVADEDVIKIYATISGSDV